MLIVSEWRRLILLYFRSSGNVQWVCTRERLLQNFTTHIDANFFKAFESLIKENKLIEVSQDDKRFIISNLQKTSEIDKEIFSNQKPLELEVIQPFESTFAKELVYRFESETDRVIPNKGKYYHFNKEHDSSFWVSIVRTRGSSKPNKLNLGSLSDPKSRISRIYKAIRKWSNETGRDTFIKKNIEDIEPMACGNTRQYSRAALDILEHLGMIRAISSKGISPIYAITNQNPNIVSKNYTLDQYCLPDEEESQWEHNNNKDKDKDIEFK